MIKFIKKSPLRIRDNKEIKSIFFNLVDDRAKSIIAKKVSKMNGDARVAFDILRSSFTELFNRIQYYKKPEEISFSQEEEIK